MADLKTAAKKEFLGQPAWVWGIAGAVVLVAAIYLYRKRSAAAAASAAGGACTDANGAPGTLDSQGNCVPAPASTGGYGTLSGVIQDVSSSPVAQATHFITAPKNLTLAELAQRNHWTPATYAEIQKLNNLQPSSKLTKGQQILRPTGVGVAA